MFVQFLPLPPLPLPTFCKLLKIKALFSDFLLGSRHGKENESGIIYLSDDVLKEMGSTSYRKLFKERVRSRIIERFMDISYRVLLY